MAHDDTKYKRVAGAIDRDYRPATFDSNNSSPTRGSARNGPYVKQVAPRYGGNEMTPARCERPGSGRTERTRTT